MRSTTLGSRVQPAQSPILWAGIVVGFFLWGAALEGWLQRSNSWEIRTQLITVSPIFLWIGAVVFVVALWLNRETFSTLIVAAFTRKQWISIVGICILAFALVHGGAPRTHRLFYDEDIYEAIALNIAQNNKAAMNNDGRWEYGHFDSKQLEFNKQPNAWPFAISLAYRIFGVSEKVGFNLSNLLYVLTVLMVFMAGTLFFDSPIAGLFAAMIYAFVPDNARWFSTIDGDPPTACFTALAMTSTLIFFRARTWRALFLMAGAWALASQFRFEVLLLAGLVFLMFYIDGWEEFRTPRLYGFLLLFLVLLFAHLLHIFAVRGDSWGASGPKMAADYVFQNLKSNTIYYFDNKRFPLIFSLLALGGIVSPGQWKAKLYVVLWFALSWGVFLFFYAGGYQFGADVRYAINSMAPLALLAGWGADRVVNAGQKWFRKNDLLFAMSAVLLVTLMFFLPYIREYGQETWQCRADHIAAESFAALVPDDGIIMTHNPNMFQIFGKNAAQMSLFTEQSRYAQDVIMPQFRGKIYLHWNYWCNTQDAVQVRFCTNMLASYETELIAEKKIGDQRFALYRVVGERPPVNNAPR
jgi:hypothetical protein